MNRKLFITEKIIGILREAEVALAHWMKVSEVCRQLGMSEQRYHWRRGYAGLIISYAKRMKELDPRRIAVLRDSDIGN